MRLRNQLWESATWTVSSMRNRWAHTTIGRHSTWSSSTIIRIMAVTAQSWARTSPRSTAMLMYEPKPGTRKSLSPSLKASTSMRKNQPPAMLIMLFQARPVVAKGSSTHLKRCHQLNRYTVPAS